MWSYDHKLVVMQDFGKAAGHKLFGSDRRTDLLTALALLEESYPRELARLLNAPLFSVQRLVDDLERQGVLVTRLIGKERRVSFSPNFFAKAELRSLLLRLGQQNDELSRAVSSVRRRPRRRSKPL